MFEGIGNIGTYAKMQMMKQRAQKNIDTGFSFTGKNEDQQQFKINMSKPKTTTKNIFRLKLIKGKLARGKKLSQGDLEYLRQTAPQIYTKALKITQDRENLEQRLKSCKTKEEAMQVRRSFVSSAATPTLPSGDASGASASVSAGTATADSFAAGASSSAESCAAISALAGSGEAAVVSLGGEEPPKINTAASYSSTGLSEMSNAIANFNAANRDDDIDLPEEILRQRAMEDAWIEYTKRKKYRDLAATEQEREKRAKHREISIKI